MVLREQARTLTLALDIDRADLEDTLVGPVSLGLGTALGTGVAKGHGFVDARSSSALFVWIVAARLSQAELKTKRSFFQYQFPRRMHEDKF